MNKDPRWRPWNPARDTLPERWIKTDKNYFDAVAPADDALAKNQDALYYWSR